MPTRNTQTVRAVPTATSATGGAARNTQTVRAVPVAEGQARMGGAARVTQCTRVVITTIQLPGGGLPLTGVGA